jgi:hypothetical protein
MTELQPVKGRVKRYRLIAQLALCLCCATSPGQREALAAPVPDEPPSAGVVQPQNPRDKDYQTPRAGEKGLVLFRGYPINIPGFDRNHFNAVTLGGSLLVPRQGTTGGLPVAALYFRHYWEKSRTRDIIGFAVNDLEYDRTLVKDLELVGQFETYTMPGDITELQNNKEMKFTAATYGNLMGFLGPGLRIKVHPFEVDNDFRLQLLGRLGYFYAERSHETGVDVIIPPDTLLYGARARLRYDGILRNILELPHRGFAFGFDADYVHRENWRNVNPSGAGSIHYDYLQLKGYAHGAMGLPGLSERNRLLFHVNGATIPDNRADRFNAFLVNGGPFPTESDDLARPYYSGQLHDYVLATSYVSGSVAYRRELAFFLYGSLIGSGIWGDRATVKEVDKVVFRERTDAAVSLQLDSAFFWESQLSLNYTWESGFIRDGRPGGGVTLYWSKVF